MSLEIALLNKSDEEIFFLSDFEPQFQVLTQEGPQDTFKSLRDF